MSNVLGLIFVELVTQTTKGMGYDGYDRYYTLVINNGKTKKTKEITTVKRDYIFELNTKKLNAEEKDAVIKFLLGLIGGR